MSTEMEYSLIDDIKKFLDEHADNRGLMHAETMYLYDLLEDCSQLLSDQEKKEIYLLLYQACEDAKNPYTNTIYFAIATEFRKLCRPLLNDVNDLIIDYHNTLSRNPNP